MFQKNVQLKPYKKVSPWRKIALSMWHNQEEASFYGWIDLDATGIIKTIDSFKQDGKRMSPTTIAAKAIAVAMSKYPQVNGLIRLGRIYERQNIDIFLQVAPDDSGENLTGMVIRNCDQKSLEEINEEIRTRVAKIKTGEKDDFMKSTKMLAALPTFLVGWIIGFISFVNYTLNIWSPLLQSPRDGFGSAMVTSVGMLGLEHGIAPLIPSNRCPIIIAVGKLEEKAVVRNGEIVIEPVLPITGTFDHRLVDGVGASHLLRALKEYIKAPY